MPQILAVISLKRRKKTPNFSKSFFNKVRVFPSKGRLFGDKDGLLEEGRCSFNPNLVPFNRLKIEPVKQSRSVKCRQEKTIGNLSDIRYQFSCEQGARVRKW
jgi:hypothetical protein